MTRAAREARGEAAARRGEVVWAAQAYINLSLLADMLPQDNPTKGVLARFVRQAPPTIQSAAALVMADKVTESHPHAATVETPLVRPGAVVPDSEARTADHQPGRGGW